MLSAWILLATLAGPLQSAAGQVPDPPEELAVGTMRSMISAQAAYSHTKGVPPR